MSSSSRSQDSSSVIAVLACVLQQLVNRNDGLQTKNVAVSKFHALRPPMISIKDYLTRIERYAQCSKECFVLALVYIDRIIQTNDKFIVSSLNIHRLIITSVMLAAKFFDDQYFNNDYYGKVGGVPCHEINSLEVEFLFMNNFTLFVTTEMFDQYYSELCSHVRSASCDCTCVAGSLLDGPSAPAAAATAASNENQSQQSQQQAAAAAAAAVAQQQAGGVQAQAHMAAYGAHGHAHAHAHPHGHGHGHHGHGHEAMSDGTGPA